MSAKKIVLNFYKSEALINSTLITEYIHPEIKVEWNSSNGFFELDYNSIINFTQELEKSYVRSKIRISHIIAKKDMVTVRYSHYVKTIENPREEMLVANFMVIWQIKDDKLYRGFQISQKP